MTRLLPLSLHRHVALPRHVDLEHDLHFHLHLHLFNAQLPIVGGLSFAGVFTRLSIVLKLPRSRPWMR